MWFFCCTFLFCCINNVAAGPRIEKKGSNHLTVKDRHSEVVYLNVHSFIQSHFATTQITSEILNSKKFADEISFHAELPDEALISNFSIRIGDKTAYGGLKKIESYSESNVNLSAKYPQTNEFEIKLIVPAETSVIFSLVYQEILKRVNGVYKHVISLNTPPQLAENISVKVDIIENGKFKKLKVAKFGKGIRTKSNKQLLLEDDEKEAGISVTNTKSLSTAHVSFTPGTKYINSIVSGQLAILYDIDRDASRGSTVEMLDGYFVHFFAPENITEANKHVVFVLDKSYSMAGEKFLKLKISMNETLNDLHPDDLFNIVLFSHEIQTWKNDSVKATDDNIRAAQNFVMKAEPNGGTNILDALYEGLKILDSSKSKKLTSLMFFVTDGHSNVGETDGDTINNNITASNNKNHIINCVAFGEDADVSLMKKIAFNNRGTSKKLFVELDIVDQLTSFYEQSSIPLLYEIKMDVPNDKIDKASLIHDSNIYFNEGELITYGRLKDKDAQSEAFKVSATGDSKTGKIDLNSNSLIWTCPEHTSGCCIQHLGQQDDSKKYTQKMENFCCKESNCLTLKGTFIERMWAYKRIKHLLHQIEIGQGNEKTDTEVLDLSLKYNFNTNVTSPYLQVAPDCLQLSAVILLRSLTVDYLPPTPPPTATRPQQPPPPQRPPSLAF